MPIRLLLWSALTVLAVTDFASSASAPYSSSFLQAKPVWIAGKELEKNLLAGFRAEFESQGDSPVVLRITASTLYRAYLNRNFLGHGPARGPHGFFRIDELDLRKLLRPGSNLLAIEVAGYNVNSYYFPQHPSFLQAEVVQQGKVLVSTGSGNGFRSAVLPCRVQKVQRYSFQRTFSEVYRLKPGWDRWRSDAGQSFGGADLAVQPAKKYLPRGVAYPRFETRSPVRLVSSGVVEQAPLPAKPWRDRALTDIGPTLGGFAEQELEFVPSMDLQKLKSKTVRGHRATDGCTGSASAPRPVVCHRGFRGESHRFSRRNRSLPSGHPAVPHLR